MDRRIINYIPGLIIHRKGNSELNIVRGFVFSPEKSGDRVDVLHFINEKGFRIPMKDCIIYLKPLDNIIDDIDELRLCIGFESGLELKVQRRGNQVIISYGKIEEDKFITITDGSLSYTNGIDRTKLLHFFYKNQYDIHGFIDSNSAHAY